MLKNIFKNKRKKEYDIQPNYNSKDYYDGILAAIGDDKISLSKKIHNIFTEMFCSKNTDKKGDLVAPSNIEVYSLKINANINSLTVKELVELVENFEIIARNCYEMFDFDPENLNISIISASSGCFNVNFGINVINNEFNLFKIQSNTPKFDLANSIVEALTGNDISKYGEFCSLLKDCITGYLTTKIYENNSKLKYIDVKKSLEAKRTIYKTIQKLPDLESVTLDGKIITKSEIDMLV